MDNHKKPAYPQPIAVREDGTAETSWGVHEDFSGLSKVEKGSLMIAAAMSQQVYADGLTVNQLDHIKITSVAIANAVLEQCNKQIDK